MGDHATAPLDIKVNYNERAGKYQITGLSSSHTGNPNYIHQDEYRSLRKTIRQLKKIRKSCGVNSVKICRDPAPILAEEDIMVAAGLQKKKKRNPYEGVKKIHIRHDNRSPELFMGFTDEKNLKRSRDIFLGKMKSVTFYNGEISPCGIIFNDSIRKIKRRIKKIIRENPDIGRPVIDPDVPGKYENAINSLYDRETGGVTPPPGFEMRID